jgi:hypothetical protein
MVRLQRQQLYHAKDLIDLVATTATTRVVVVSPPFPSPPNYRSRCKILTVAYGPRAVHCLGVGVGKTFNH